MTVAARSPVDDALAVLRRGCYLGGELPTVEEVEAALATVRSELEQLREERDAAEKYRQGEKRRREAAEAETRRLTEGLREAVDMIRFPCAECKPFIDKARALLADSPDGANTEGGEA